MPEEKVVSRAPAASPTQLDFPPIRNGVDYLLSAVDHLGFDRTDPRGIKYAVLHLHAAAEVLLKTRLVREHWSLVFDDPGQATERAFRSGGFKSCTLTQAVVRLRNIAGITITAKEDEALGDLGRDRNALQHYGLTHNARAVEARAGRVLDFLVRFLDDVLLPGLGLDETNAIGADMVRVRDRLTTVRAFITQRLRRLNGDLQGREERTVRCPHCEQLTMIAEGETNRCLFCRAVDTTAEMMAYVFLGTPEDAGSLIGICPTCAQHTVVYDTDLATGDRRPFCFSCPGPLPSTPDAPPTDTARDRP
ncbi:hypothetical protein OG840_59715 [Streptomyces sp. NBC_01764]|uniref:hypothetical protein n=1 Tax=Streptomyces sp. NBC_01764 TaxID=2975935 RepID=UPI002254988A|nr:hypothetical protein [Streptomyces sp. NBC_01764]MCX4411253.1 hypothetical protein [Streptomyces sp. NBC_01764]